MVLLNKKHDERAARMYTVLNEQPKLYDALKNDKNENHPWQLITWNVAKYLCMDGRYKTACEYFDRAYRIAVKNRDNIATVIFGTCILASKLYFAEQAQVETKTVTRDFYKEYDRLSAYELPESMRAVFPARDSREFTMREIENIAENYLR